MSRFAVSAVWRKMRENLYNLEREVNPTKDRSQEILNLKKELKLLEWKFSSFELKEVTDPVTNKKYLHLLNRENEVVEGIELELPYQVSGGKELTGHVVVIPYTPAQENTENTGLELVLGDLDMVNRGLAGSPTLNVEKQPFKNMEFRWHDSGSILKEKSILRENFKGRFKVVKEDDNYVYWGAVIDEEASGDYGTIFIPVYKSKPETSTKAKELNDLWLEKKFEMNSPDGKAWLSAVHLALEENEITWLEHRKLLDRFDMY